MRKFFYTLTLAVVIVTAACSDDDKGMSEEQLYLMKNNGWADNDLLGSVKRVESRLSYDISGIGWDSIAKKPAVTPTKSYIGATLEFNSVGCLTLESRTRNIITGAKKAGSDIIITSCALHPNHEEKYTYDSKNRPQSYELVGYNYRISCSGSDLSWHDNVWVDDTLFSYADNDDAFKLRVDTIPGNKIECTYDDAAKTATVSYYYWLDGNWKLNRKEVRTLNKYGYVDGNSNKEVYSVKPTATIPELESKPGYGEYNVLDGQGNWTEQYSVNYYSGNYYLNDYESRDITYY